MSGESAKKASVRSMRLWTLSMFKYMPEQVHIEHPAEYVGGNWYVSVPTRTMLCGTVPYFDFGFLMIVRTQLFFRELVGDRLKCVPPVSCYVSR